MAKNRVYQQRRLRRRKGKRRRARGFGPGARATSDGRGPWRCALCPDARGRIWPVFRTRRTGQPWI